MAIETRKSARRPYLVRIEVRSPDGRRKQQRVGSFRSKREAEKAEALAIASRERGTLLSPDTTTVAELLDAWLAVKAHEVTSNCLHDYETTIRRHIKPALGTVKIQRLSAARLQAQYAAWTDADLSARVVRGCHMRLSQALDYAVRMKLLLHNPAKDARAPRLQRSRFDYWNPHEAAHFLETAKGDSLYPLWDLLLREGMRRGEALGLRWADINWERETAHIVQSVVPDKANRGAARIQGRTKTARGSRTVRLTTETVEALREHHKRWLARKLHAGDWQETDLIICTGNGGPINPNNVARSFNALVKSAGLRRIKLHELRHTSATLLLLAGEHAKVVSDRLGHASISITLDTYSHVLPDLQDAAAARMSAILGITLAELP